MEENYFPLVLNSTRSIVFRIIDHAMTPDQLHPCWPAMSVDLLGEAFLIRPCGGERGERKDKMERLNEKQRKSKGWMKGWETNLDKRESAMLSALPPGSSTPLCSHLTKYLLRIASSSLLHYPIHSNSFHQIIFRLTRKILRLQNQASDLSPLLLLKLQWSLVFHKEIWSPSKQKYSIANITISIIFDC